MADGTVVTGVYGTAIGAQCTGPEPGTEVLAQDVNFPLQSVCNDLATIRSGSYTCTASPTMAAGLWTWNDPAQCDFNGFVLCSKGVSFAGTCAVSFDPTAIVNSNIPLGNNGGSLAALPVTGISNTHPALVCLGYTLSQVPWLQDGVDVVYSGSGASGEAHFVANVLPYIAPLPWGAGAQYQTPTDSRSGAGPNHPCSTTHGGYYWVCETSGTATNPPTGAIGSTFGDFGGAPTWRNIGVDVNAVVELVGSIGNSGSPGGGATLVVPAQIYAPAARNSTRVLSRWRPDATSWGVSLSGVQLIPEIANVTNGNSCMWQIGIDEVPQGAKLTQVTVWYQPTSGHVAFPASMPVVSLVRTHLNTQSQYVIGSTSPSYGSLAAYEQPLATVVTVTQNEPYQPNANPSPYVQPYEVVDHSRYRYDIHAVFEYGPNALPGTLVYGAQATCLVSYIAQQP